MRKGGGSFPEAPFDKQKDHPIAVIGGFVRSPLSLQSERIRSEFRPPSQRQANGSAKSDSGAFKCFLGWRLLDHHYDFSTGIESSGTSYVQSTARSMADWSQLRRELPLRRHRLGEPSSRAPVCGSSNREADSAEFRASVFGLARAVLDSLDGSYSIVWSTSPLQAGVFVLVNITYMALLWETFERADEREISAQARRMMRVRSFLTLGVFSLAAVLSIKLPLYGLGLVCCCLVFYLRPEAPHGAGDVSRFLAILRDHWRR